MENVIEENVIEEKKIVVKTAECFEILRIINKMQIKKDLIELFQRLMKIGAKVGKYERELLELAEKKYKNDRRKAVANNIELAEKYDNATMEQNSLGLEALLLVGENIPNAESEVKRLIAKVHNISMEEVEEFEAFELIEKVKDIIMCQSFARFFSSISKMTI